MQSPHTLNVTDMSFDLRTHHFRTRQRDKTIGVYIAYANTPADPRVDAKFMDVQDAMRGSFGVGCHYLVKLDGTIDICRYPMTIAGYPSKGLTNHDHLVIGVAGGRDNETYDLVNTITEAQEVALEVLLQCLSNALEVELEVIDYATTRFMENDDITQIRVLDDDDEFEEELLDEKEAATAYA